MAASVASIWRHPVKAHGREELAEVTLEQGKALPMDRVWAVAHERSCFDVSRPSWQPPSEFSRGASSPRLQAVTCWSDDHLGRITFSHPDLVDITIDPDDEGDQCRFVQWIMPISLGARLLPSRLVRAQKPMTDTDFASISIINLASHRALAKKLGIDLSPLRWRGNLLVEGWPAWAERDMVGKRLTIGDATLEIREEIRRCRMTEANPETGVRDANTLAALRDEFGHQEMGIYAVVIEGGRIFQGAEVKGA